MENIRAAKYNKRRSPGITGELLSLTSLCQSTRGKLLKPPVQSCNTDTIRPELKSGWGTHRFVIPPPTMEVDGTVSSVLNHRPTPASGLHITKHLQIENS